ncbi:MAG: SDR family oxidoreductase [Deltaproteobacteria bacterium]|nr:SDR family oxidoreductase [Deltaproteobacteria bacterium]MDZ4341044.1 SDR family oxidoreductase [Candidatus Binatia bacterium]
MAEQATARPLHGKVVLVTGASRGIGAAAAKRLAQSGASVIINYHHNREAAEKVLREIEDRSGRGMVFQADVTRKEAVEAMVRAAREKLGAVDALVNNAYFPFEVGQLHELSWETFHRAVEHELAAFHHCVQACLPGMQEKQAGRIIVISTRLAQQPLPKMGAYAAAKSALESMADTMAIELGPLGIAVNVVTPAFTLTDASMIMPEAFRERVKETRPLKKHLYPEDVAGTIAFLAGDEASMLTGSHVLITGGSHLQL